MDGYIPTNSAFCTEFIFLHILCGIENKNSLIISKLPIIKIEDKIVSEIIFLAMGLFFYSDSFDHMILSFYHYNRLLLEQDY